MEEQRPTPRRRRQVRWAKRLRRVGLAWQNALEIARAGRLTAPYGAPFEVIHEERVYKLRHYAATDGTPQRVQQPLLLVPPLMVASEVYDISPDVSAVAYLSLGRRCLARRFQRARTRSRRHGRTLDDHVRAVWTRSTACTPRRHTMSTSGLFAGRDVLLSPPRFAAVQRWRR
jgi:putative long chain acyl-CoA synthase